MTAIRHNLQKNVFTPEDERLVSVLSVIKVGKKKGKEAEFLCLTLSQQPPIAARLSLVKAMPGKGGEALKRKKTWLLRELKAVDGINPRKAVPEIQLQLLDKLYKWEIPNMAEKEPFIHHLYKLASRHVASQRPEFMNVSMPVEKMEAEAVEEELEVEGGRVGGSDEFAPLSAKEEADFRALLARCNVTIGQAEGFAHRLTKELNLLDGANIQSIMGSEDAVLKLIGKLDEALKEAEQLENLLDSLDSMLLGVRESVDMMQEKDNVIGIESSNKRKLMDDLALFLDSVELVSEHEEALSRCDLDNPRAINRVTLAAQKLQRAMNAQIPPGLAHMKAYKDQQELFRQLSDRVADRLTAHLGGVIEQLDSETKEAGDWHALCLPKHSQRHHALKVFSDLVAWLSTVRPQSYTTLKERYVAHTKELYKRQLMIFFDSVKAELKPQFDRRPSVSSRMNASGTLGRSSKSASALAAEDPRHIDREQFQKLMETLLSELEPVVLDEQKFVIRFLHLSSSPTSAQMNTSEKAFNGQVRAVLEALFKPLEALLREFVMDCRRARQSNVVFLLARLSRHVMSVQDTGSYIAVIFGSILIIVKRQFDEYMDGVMKSLVEVRLTKKTRLGILDSVGMLEDVARDMEFAWTGVERKAEAEKWYPKLVGALWEGVESAATDPLSKAPPAVLRMENYHAIHSLLAALKIPCLEGMKKEARQRYQDAVSMYSAEFMGKPLERLSAFFEAIGDNLEKGMRPDEIGYQAAFSKNELKKNIAAYPGKDLQKGLELMYRKLEKHLGTDSPLLQVVWHQMQDDLIQQYKFMESLMAQCYPNSGLRLDFSLQDLLSYFSDIAMQH